MKNFAGSSITYYGLAREKVMSKYPRLANILTILALICMTGLALFLISDLVSFASNSDHKVVLAGLDVAQNTGGKPTNAAAALKGTNNSETEENLSIQINMPQMNASSSSSQAAEGIISSGGSSSGRSRQSISEESGSHIVKKRHSSSSISSSSTSPTSTSPTSSSPSSSSPQSAAEPANESNEIPLINQSLKNSTANQLNISDIAGSGISGDLPSVGTANDSQSSIKKGFASLPIGDKGGILIPTRDASPREPTVMIQFKTGDPTLPESEQGLNSDSQLPADIGTTPDAGATPDFAIRESATASQENKVTASSQAQKVQQARAKLMASRNEMAESMKKKRAQLRAKNTDSNTVSDTSLPSDSGVPESGPATDGSNIEQGSKDAQQNPNSQVGKQSDSSQEGEVTALSQAQKARQARAEQIASRKKMIESRKEKAAQSREKAAQK